jgi:hypothetical protein
MERMDGSDFYKEISNKPYNDAGVVMTYRQFSKTETKNCETADYYCHSCNHFQKCFKTKEI